MSDEYTLPVNDDIYITGEIEEVAPDFSEIDDDDSTQETVTRTPAVISSDNRSSIGSGELNPSPSDAVPADVSTSEVIVTQRVRHQIDDYEPAALKALSDAGAVFYGVYADGHEEGPVSWTEVHDLDPEGTIIELDEEIASAIAQNFWADTQGVHITDDPYNEWIEAYESNPQFPNLSTTKNYYNILLNAGGALLRRALNNLVSINRTAISFYDGLGNASTNIMAFFGRNGAQIGRSDEKHVVINSSGIGSYNGDGTVADFTMRGSSIVNSTISGSALVDNTITGGKIANATITGAKIDSGTITNANIANGTITGAKIDSGTITNANIADGTIQGSKIQGSTLTDIPFAAITDADVEVASIADAQIATATIGEAQVENLTTNYAHLQNGVIDNATINHADVNGLNTTYATISNLNSATARIDDLEADHVSVTDFEAEQGYIDALQAATADIATIRADSAKVHSLTAAQLSAATAYIAALNADNITAASLSADVGKIHNLTANEISAAAAYIAALNADSVTAQNIIAMNGDFATVKANAAKVANLTAAQLEADHATVGSLDANYAQINMANVNNAWIANGTIKDGAISNGMINSVSANKLTAGTIDASNITVTNLNADNITTGTINGQRIGEGSLSLSKLEEDVYTETEVNNIVSNLQTQIDGAIETWTGTAVPTLSNSPASAWTTNAIKDTHVGDVYFVVNSQSQQNGYNYRFTKSGNTYSWQLIKDSDVTNALQRLTTAEGKIGNIEQFDSDISSWKTDTDEEISSIKSAATTLTGRVSTAEGQIATKVDTTTFNTLSQTVGENSSAITQLTTETTTISSKVDSQNPFIIGTQTAQTGSWTGNAPTLASLVDGQQITYWLPYAPSGNASLNLTLKDGSTTGAIPCYYSGTSRLTTHYSANNAIHLTYRTNISGITQGWWADANYDSNTPYTKYSDTVISGKNGLKRYTLCMRDDAGNFTSIVNQANNTNVSGKTCYTGGLQLGSVCYHATGGDYAAGANSGVIYESYGGIDFRYSVNGVANAASTELQLGKPVYLVGTIGADGLFYLDTTKWWTQTSFVEGKAYVLVGTAYSSYYAIFVAVDNPTYIYEDDELVEIQTSRITKTTNKVNTVSDTVDEHTRKIGNLETTIETKADGSTVETISNNLNTISDTVSGHTQTISSITSTQTTMQGKLDKTLVETTQLWFSKADTTAPNKPTTQVTSTATTGNAWTTVVPAYNASYPNYYYCYQWKYSDGTYGWSSVTRDIATGEMQATARQAQNDIDNLEIGGRNLLLWSGDANHSPVIRWGSQNNVTSKSYDATYDAFKYVTPADSGNQNNGMSISTQNVGWWVNEYGSSQITNEKTYTFSIDVMGTLSSGNLMTMKVFYSTSAGDWVGAPNPAVDITDKVKSDSFTRVSVTFTLPSIRIEGTRIVLSLGAKGATFYVKNPKLELGNRATDWSPAPEDVDADILTAQTSADNAQSTADKNVKSSIQLWFTKANGSAPAKPTAKVTSTSTSGNAWTTVVPTYNSGYPHYFYCWQYELADGTCTWSDVIYDRATTENQSNSRSAVSGVSTLTTKTNNIQDTVDGHTSQLSSITSTQTTIQGSAVKSTVQLWFTKSDTTAPAKPTAHVTTDNPATGNAWNLAVPTYNASYPNYYYCYEYQYLNDTYGWSAVTRDIATGEMQERARTAITNAANAQADIDGLEIGGRNLFAMAGSIAGYLGANGIDISAQSASKERTTDYISVDANTKYVFQAWYDQSNPTSSYMWICLSWYTSDKTHISQPLREHMTEDNYKSWVVTSPTNAAYARLSARWVEPGWVYGKVKFERGTKPTDWSPAPEDVSSDATSKANAAEASAKAYTDAVEIGGRNYYRAQRQVNGSNIYVNAGTVTISDYTIILTASGSDLFYAKYTNTAGIDWTPYFGYLIPVTPGESLTLTTLCDEVEFNKNYIGYWDSNKKTLSSGVGIYSTTKTVLVPNGASYANVRVGYGAAVSGTTYHLKVKLEKGTKATDWTPAPEDVDADISTAQTSADNAQATANKNVKESQQLWFTKANGSAPNKPTSKVTSTSTSGNAWTTKVPTYSSSYPYYFYCMQYIAADGTVTWSDVVYDQATTEAQSVARTTSANLSTLQSDYATFKQTTQNFESTIGTTYATKTELSTTNGNVTALQNRNDTLDAQYGYPYKKDIIVYGESNKYYPVYFTNTGSTKYDQYVTHEVMIKRGYAEQGPSDWNTSTHRGSLNLHFGWNYGSWGGATYKCDIYEFSEMYSTLLGDILVGADWGVFSIVYLRGGGTTGAIYHIYSDVPFIRHQYMANAGVVGENDVPYIGLEQNLVYAKSGDTYQLKVRAPLTTPNVAHLTSLKTNTSMRFTLVRSNLNETQWASYSTIGHTDNWYPNTPLSSSSTYAIPDCRTLNVGDTFTVTGVSSDKSITHSIVCEVTAVPTTEHGNIPAKTIAVNDNSTYAKAVESRVSTAETSIQQNTNSIALKANSSDVYTKTQTDGLISTEVSNRNSAIEQSTNAINLSVSQTYTTKTEFNNLEIGGRNLLYKRVSAGARVTANGDYSIILNASENLDTYFTLYTRTQLVEGTTYVISCEASGINGEGVFYNFPLFRQGSTINGLTINRNGTNSFSFVMNATELGYHVASTVDDLTVYKVMMDDAGRNIEGQTGPITLTNFKLEKGNKPTDWTPAPEDMLTTAAFESARSEIQQTTDGITSTVSKISSVKYYTGNSSTLANIKVWAAEGYTNTWTFTGDLSNLRVGDTVYLKYGDTTRGCNVYIKGTVNSISGQSVNFTSHGYEDVLPVDTIKSTINQSADSVKIEARHVNIEGAAIFSSGGRLSDANIKKTANTIPDTRNDNQPPSWYFTNYPKQTVTEFKLASTMGLSGDYYCYVTTVTGWADSGGGYPKQTAQIGNESYWRVGTSQSEWGAWQESETVSGAEDRIQTAYSKIQSRGEQLVVNGNGFMGDNTNFSSLTFDGSVANGSPGSFTDARGISFQPSSDEMFPVDPSKNYRVEFDVTSSGSGASPQMYGMLYMYDVDKKLMNVQQCSYIVGSTTTLARELKNGDTTVYLTDASGFIDTSAALQRSLIFWDYTNSFGYTYPPETYSRNFVAPSGGLWSDYSKINKTNNTIQLTSAWTGGTHVAGTSVSQNSSGATYAYFWSTSNVQAGVWTHVSSVYDGYQPAGISNAFYKFYRGTAYCKIAWLWNYQGSSSNPQRQLWVTNISVREDVATSAELNTVKGNAVKRTQRIYYRKSSVGAPSTPGVTSSNWVTQTGDVFGQWTAKVPRLTANANGTGTKYLYLYTCEQREMGDGTLSYTTVLLDDSNTIIDGGTIITGSIAANKLDVYDATIGKISTSAINLTGYAQTNDIPTKVSDLTNDTGFVTNDDIQIGGRNLLLWTAELPKGTNTSVSGKDGITAWGSANNLLSETADGIKLTAAGNSQECIGIPLANDGSVENNEDVLLTFEARGNITSVGQFYWLQSSGANVTMSSWLNGSSTISLSETTWTKFTTPVTNAQANVRTCTKILMFYALGSSNSGKWIEIRKRSVKLERGNKATDWSPAPEDIAADISSKADPSDIPTKVSDLTNDSGFQDSSQVETAITSKGYATQNSLTSEINQRKAQYGTCSTAAATQAKAVTCSNFELAAGKELTVKFTTANTYASGAVQLNVNSKGAKNVWVANAVTSSSNQLLWGANAYITFRYDGTQFIAIGEPRTWYGASTTAEGTAAKTDTTAVTGCVICKGAKVELAMTNANTAASPTLNIQSTGAKNVYFGNGTARPTKADGTSWLATNTCTFTFDGQYWRTAGKTYIDANSIVTGYLSADRIEAGSLSANKISATSGTFDTANIPDLSAAKITSGDISADRIKANVISAINSLTAGQIDAGRINASQLSIGQSQVTNLTSDLADAKKHTQVIVSATNVNYVANTCTLTARFYIDGVLQTSTSLKWQWYRDGTTQGSQTTGATGSLAVTSSLGLAHRYACKCTF